MFGEVVWTNEKYVTYCNVSHVTLIVCIGYWSVCLFVPNESAAIVHKNLNSAVAKTDLSMRSYSLRREDDISRYIINKYTASVT